MKAGSDAPCGTSKQDTTITAQREGEPMRLIDADMLKQKVIENRDPDWSVVIKPCYEDILNAPTIDAVQVVRCKDCIHSEYDDKFWLLTSCPMYDDWAYREKPVTGECFCSFGEKKPNGH